MEPSKLKKALAKIPGAELVKITNTGHKKYYYKSAGRPIICSHGSNRPISRNLLDRIKKEIEEQTGVERNTLDEHFAKYM